MNFSSCGYMANDPTTLVNTVFPEVVCFQGIHILHVTLSYFMILLLLLMCYVITCCCYESRLGRTSVSRYH